MNRRDLLKGAAGAALALRSHGAETPRKTPWYRSLLVGIEIGPTGANDKDHFFMASASGQDWVDALVRAQAQYGVIFMKDQNFAYYNSRLARKCPNLGSRDLLQECLVSAREHQIPIVAYCQIQYDTSAWEKHPDWRMKDFLGNDIKNRLCYRSAYLQYNQEIAAEMMKYPISGFHFDMLDFGFGPPYGCWCARCQTDFQNTYGTNMPKAVTWDDAWDKFLKFRGDSNTAYCQAIQSFVQSKRPELSVDFNYHGYPPFNWVPGEKPVQHARNGDFVTAEGLPWVFGHNNPSLLSLFMAGARPGGPIQGVTSRSVYNYHDFSVRPTAEMTWETMTYLAHGAQCTIVDKANYEGTLDAVCYDRIGSVFYEARSKADKFNHPAVSEVGLYYSCRSRDWFGREEPAKYMEAFCGAHRALMQAHLAMGMIMDENVTAERLRSFPVIYLPNTAILDERECSLFSDYVSAGGTLLATGLTGLYNRNGKPLADQSLAQLLGVRFIRSQTEHSDNYFRLPSALASSAGSFLLRNISPDWPILTFGPVATYEAQGARQFGELMTAYRSQDNQWSRHMSPQNVAGPAVFVHEQGKGTAILIPCAIDAAFIGQYRVPEHRELLHNVIRYLNPKPELQIQAPANVESVITRPDAGTLLVHTLCYSAPPTAATPVFNKGRTVLPPVMEEPAWYQATIVARQPFTRARAANPRTRLTVEGKRITVFTDAIHEVITIEA